jgi:septal ring factor EnvC (AmiA/AmiB activator)
MMVLIFGVAMVTVTSCAWHPSEEEIKALEETKSATLSAEKSVADKKVERQELERKVAAKKAELEKVKADKASVQQHVDQNKTTEPSK